jgi:hypothetical protein
VTNSERSVLDTASLIYHAPCLRTTNTSRLISSETCSRKVRLSVVIVFILSELTPSSVRKNLLLRRVSSFWITLPWRHIWQVSNATELWTLFNIFPSVLCTKCLKIDASWSDRVCSSALKFPLRWYWPDLAEFWYCRGGGSYQLYLPPYLLHGAGHYLKSW